MNFEEEIIKLRETKGLCLDLCYKIRGEKTQDLMRGLARALQGGNCPQGLQINLSWNSIGSVGIQALAEALQSGRCSQGLRLDLCGNQISNVEMEILAEALRSRGCPEGLQLNLDWNMIGDAGAKALADALQSGSSPHELGFSLRGNFIGEKGAKDLALALQDERCPRRLRLDLSHNRIGDQGAEALAQALQSERCLQEELWIRLDFNKIGHEGISALTKAISHLFKTHPKVEIMIEGLLGLEALCEAQTKQSLKLRVADCFSTPNYEAAIHLLDRLIYLDTKGIYLNWYAIACIKLGKYQDAESYSNLAINKARGNSESNRVLALCYVTRAYASAYLDHCQLALDDCDQAANLLPLNEPCRRDEVNEIETFEVFSVRALIFAKLGSYQQAEHNCQKALDHEMPKPTHFVAYIRGLSSEGEARNENIVSLKMEDYRKAREYFQEALGSPAYREEARIALRRVIISIEEVEAVGHTIEIGSLDGSDGEESSVSSELGGRISEWLEGMEEGDVYSSSSASSGQHSP